MKRLLSVAVATLACSASQSGRADKAPVESAPATATDASKGRRPGRSKPTKSSVVVIMRGFRSNEGRALVALFSSKKGFPDQPLKAERRVETAIRKGTARAVFKNVPPGDYAVAVLHDEDGDRKMKTGMFGIPKEGYGVSQNAQSRFGPPDYADCDFSVKPVTRVTTRIDMRYH